jgi:NitT/TauT family transport system substrate-binding protein/sulfonate transport system substrate-binding protein
MAKTWMAGLLALIAIGCGSNDDVADTGPVKIRMGWGVPEEEVKYVLMKHPEIAPGLGKQYTLEWHQFAGTPLGVQGLAAGTLDCATVGGLSVANGLDKGADIVLLSELIEERKPNFTTPWMVRKDSGINSLKDLKGKTVATNAVGGSTDYFQDDYIERQTGLKANVDYKKVEVPFGQMVETVLSGRADMGLFPQPFYGQINATGKVKTLFRLNDGIEPFVQLLNGCRRSFADDHADAIRAFKSDWVRVTRWIADPENRDKVVAASAAATKIPADVLARFLLADGDYYRPPDGKINLDALQREWDFFHDNGAFKRDLKVSEHIG